MTEQIEYDYNSSDMVTVGNSETSISPKLYQDIYHQITGRTEQTSKRYSENILVEFSDIAQIHHKISQLLDIHHVLAKNESITVYYDKSRKENFTSFARFKIFHADSPQVIESISFLYNISIMNITTKKPQEYKITIDITSRVAQWKTISEDENMSEGHRNFIMMFASITAEISIEYVDYVIARGFLEAFDEWIQCCRKTEKSFILKILKKFNSSIPTGIKIFSLTIAMLTLYTIVKSIDEIDFTNKYLAQLFIVITCGIYIISSVMNYTCMYIQSGIEKYNQISYIKITKGDAQVIDEFKKNNLKLIATIIFNTTITIVFGVCASKLAILF